MNEITYEQWLKWVDGLLAHWGNEALKGKTRLGFKSITVEGRAAQDGGFIRNETYKPQPDDPVFDEIDRAVATLDKMNKRILVEEYTRGGTKETKADRLRISRNTYHQRLRQAQCIMMGLLNHYRYTA